MTKILVEMDTALLKQGLHFRSKYKEDFLMSRRLGIRHDLPSGKWIVSGLRAEQESKPLNVEEEYQR